MTDQGFISLDLVPRNFESVPPMEDFRISVEGILKPPEKAAGPDKLKPFLLQEVRK